jgi:Domain of unknown function (DUF4956)
MILLQEITNPNPEAIGHLKQAGNQFLGQLSLKFFIRLFIDLLSVFALIRFVYHRAYRKVDQYFTFFAFNVAIFLITNLLNRVELSMGAAFGLFAVFSMLRYRTESISTKDMTYLFLVIAIGLLSAVGKGNWDELSVLNLILIGTAAILESNIIIKREYSKHIQYEKIGLILPEKRTELLEDLRLRTGLNVHRVEVQSIDFLKDATQIIIYYQD